MSKPDRGELESHVVSVNVKLSLLWAALMSLFIYNDYFSLYLPGTIEMMQAGRMGPLGPATDAVLVGVSILMAVPALMIYLSAVLPPALNRWVNGALGVVYAIVTALTFPGSRPFYQMVVVLEIVLASLIVWYAFHWPRHGASVR
jgi:hypothetical protein